MNDYIPITPKGMSALQEELRKLQSEDMPEVVKMISEAADQGDLSENAEYHSAKEKQSIIQNRINILMNMIARARIINIADVKDRQHVRFGATVGIIDLDTNKQSVITLLSDYESESVNGAISINSPMGSALLGAKCGDIIDLSTISGDKVYEVKSISYDF